MIKILDEKKNLSEDFKQRFDIDFKVLFNPYNPEFNKYYALEEDSNENLLAAVKLKAASRQLYIISSFLVYTAAKSVLWRRGYFAKFFYRQRFLSFPLLLVALGFSTKKTIKDLNNAGVLQYYQKRIKFDRDSKMVEKLLTSKLNLENSKKATEESQVNIQKIIDK